MYQLVILIVIILIVVYLQRKKFTGGSPFANKDQVIDKLKKGGWKLYTKDGCIWCERQLEVLRTNREEFPHIKSGAESERLGIDAFPTWVDKNGVKYPGSKDLNGLAAMINKQDNKNKFELTN